MTTSNNAAWNPIVAQMITTAYQQLGVIAEDETPTAAMYNTAIMMLNSIVAAAQATGLHVWTEEEAILFIEPGQVRYEIGGPGTNANTADETAWLELTLNTNAAAAATAIHVNTIVGVNSGDNIGVILDNGVTFWTTVNGAPSGSTIALTNALPSSSSSGNFALVYEASTIVLSTVLTADAAAAATSLVVASIVGFANGDSISVVLDTGAVYKTTVSGTPSGFTIAIAGSLPSQASSGAEVSKYGSGIARPLKVPAARLLTLQGLNETPMTIMSRQEYMDTPNKRSPGTPTQWFYSPQRDRGLFYIWPNPNVTGWAIRFTWYRPLQNFFSPGDTMDFPQEWVAPLLWTLAKDLIGIYDTPPMRQAYIKEQAQLYGDLTVNYDRESEPIQFGMSWEFTQGV